MASLKELKAKVKASKRRGKSKAKEKEKAGEYREAMHDLSKAELPWARAMSRVRVGSSLHYVGRMLDDAGVYVVGLRDVQDAASKANDRAAFARLAADMASLHAAIRRASRALTVESPLVDAALDGVNDAELVAREASNLSD